MRACRAHFPRDSPRKSIFFSVRGKFLHPRVNTAFLVPPQFLCNFLYLLYPAFRCLFPVIMFTRDPPKLTPTLSSSFLGKPMELIFCRKRVNPSDDFNTWRDGSQYTVNMRARMKCHKRTRANKAAFTMLQTARASDYTVRKRKRKGDKEKKEMERRSVLKTVLPNKRPNFIDVTADAVQGSDLLRPAEPRLRVFDTGIALSSRLLLIPDFLKTAMRAIRASCARRESHRKVNELFSVCFSFVPTLVNYVENRATHQFQVHV